MTTTRSAHDDPVLTASLRAAVTAHPTADKILIVTDTTAGLSLVHHLALSGTPWSNLRVLSVQELARSWIEGSLVREGLEPASPAATVLVVEEALEEAARDPHGIFAGVPRTPGLVSTAHATVQDLRMAGLRPEDLRPEALESERKAARLLAPLPGAAPAWTHLHLDGWRAYHHIGNKTTSSPVRSLCHGGSLTHLTEPKSIPCVEWRTVHPRRWGSQPGRSMQCTSGVNWPAGSWRASA